VGCRNKAGKKPISFIGGIAESGSTNFSLTRRDPQNQKGPRDHRGPFDVFSVEGRP